MSLGIFIKQIKIMTQEKEYLTTNQVSKMLGLHRNTLTNPKYTELLKPYKHSNNRDNLYSQENVDECIKKLKEGNPRLVFPFEIAKSEQV